MAALKRLWKFLFSPQLYKIYQFGQSQSVYEPNSLERWGDRVINSLYVLWNIGVYTSPVIATVLYKKGYFVYENLPLATKVLIGIGLIFSSAYCIRAIGRLINPEYVTFYEFYQASKHLPALLKQHLRKYDCEFSFWPVAFKWNDVELDEGKTRFNVNQFSTRGTVLDTVFSFPCRIISYLVAHTFGIKMVYPGSIRTLQSLMFPVILQGRTKLIEEFDAERFKLQTRDNNDIDSIFIDRRKTPHSNGSTLVICCEGNAGFYEIGMAMTPIEANYSVLGWNHPGFGGSTGTPFPSQEQNAIDCVVQFAIHKLGFDPKDILIFGWSIGGYTASWAAMNYPDIRGVILDATFDDILPLAIPRMPGSLEPIVRRTIREYINLNVFEQISKYNGPVTFIRRTEDEIICTEEGNLSTNRGNHLVAKFLKYRYPKIYDEKRQGLLNEWLASDSVPQSYILEQYRVDRDQCNALLTSYLEDYSLTYPMQIGENFTDEQKYHMALFLVDNHLKNYRSTHCTPLPISMFREPWSPMLPDSGFVKI